MEKKSYFKIKIIFCVVYSLISLNAIAQKNSARKGATIIFHSDDLKDSSEVQIRFLGDVKFKESNLISSIAQLDPPTPQPYKKRLFNHTCNFTWKNINASKYEFGIPFNTKNGHDLSFNFIMSPGDFVLITEKNNVLTFSGRNAKNYECEYRLRRHIDNDVARKILFNPPPEPAKAIPYWNKVDSIAEGSIRILSQFKKSIPHDTYVSILGDLIGYYGVWKQTRYIDYASNDFGDKYFSSFKGYHSKIWNKYRQSELNDNTSIGYLNFRLDQYRLDSCLVVGKNYNTLRAYNYFTHLYSGIIREWFVYEIIYHNFNYQDKDFSVVLSKAINSGFIRNKNLKRYFLEIKNTYSPGSIAYEFSLPDTTGNIVRQSDLRGKVVLLHTWHDPCGPCAYMHHELDSIRKLVDNKEFIIADICNAYTGFTQEKWRSAMATGKYTSKENLNLFLGYKTKNEFLIHYKIDGDPTLILIGKNGKVIGLSSTDGAVLIKAIRENL